MSMTHKELCIIGAKILKTKFKCTVSINECVSLKENPDVLGFRYSYGYGDYEGSILLEAKTSRSDFKADSKKLFRQNPETGIGNWRFYICPTDLIKPNELPPKWGLIYVNEKGNTKIIVDPYKDKSTRRQNKFTKFNSEAERYILTRWLSKTENPENIVMQIRETNNKFSRACKTIESQKDEIKNLKKYQNVLTSFSLNGDMNIKTHDELLEELERLREIEFHLQTYHITNNEYVLNKALNLIDK